MIKKYLPYFQFAAVVMTIVLGMHTALDRLLSETGPVIRFIPDTNKVTKQGNMYRIDFTVMLLREDCSVAARDIYIEDELGLRFPIQATSYMPAETERMKDFDPMKGLKKGYVDLYAMFSIPDTTLKEIKGKSVHLGGNISYQCPEGAMTVFLPQGAGEFNVGK
jgi:hypothetical protein